MEQQYRPIGLDTVVVRDSSLPATGVDDDLVILNIATGRYIGLDHIGREIWERIATPTTVSGLCDTLARRYRAGADQIAEDVTAFLHELADQSLIRIAA
ncbi:MAG: PqqD family protein [Candidatus Sphingomonas phytovorans]|nr:PqqD family protein [Sphingomonas sp.]WEK00391.1 MAG: PqqD family protein [Sphingomonas sp.]